MAVTARQHLVSLYTDELAANIARKYAVHCTEGKRVVEATDKAAHEEYQKLIKLFTTILDKVVLEEEVRVLRQVREELANG